MNATNRVAGRVLLLITGSLLVALGALVIAMALRPPILEPVLSRIENAAAEFGETLSGSGAWAPGGGAFVPTAIAAIVSAVAVAVLIAFIASRGGGRTVTVVQLDRGAGRVSVDRDVADAVLAGELRRRGDVLSARADTYRVRGEAAVRLTVRPRRGADLVSLTDAAAEAVASWDALAGVRVPVLLHLCGRRSPQRAPVRVV